MSEEDYVEIPAVFAVEDTYRIMVRCRENAVMWIKIGEECYYDHSNGVLRSNTDIHGITVPSEALNEAKEYTVCVRSMTERKPYFTVPGELSETTYRFFPPEGDKIRAYHIADAHNRIDEPVRAAKAFGKIDFLILNGDIPDHSGEIRNFDNIYKLCGMITGGNIPVVFARGNHDMRGIYAEKFEEYTPTSGGRSYYTVRLNGIWLLVLDCGEDKSDDNEEYGCTVCCHSFRLEETEFIKRVAREKEFEENGIFLKAVVCHSPFTQAFKPPFDIEKELYAEWTRLLNDEIKPDIMICGHNHRITLDKPEKGRSFPVAVMSEMNYKDYYYVGAGFEFDLSGGSIEIRATDSHGNTKEVFEVQI